MKKFLSSLFVLAVALCGFCIATDIPVTELSSTTSCNQNETVEYKFYLDNNGVFVNPYDVFGNNVDSLIGGGNNGSSINIWRNGVISDCNLWNRVSNIVAANDSNGALIFLNYDNCKFNIPNYTKTANPTAIDAQIHYTIGYRLVFDDGSNTKTDRRYHRDHGVNYWTCYPDGNTGSSTNVCRNNVTLHYGSQKYHTGECLNYKVFWCGDGLVNSPYGTNYYNGTHVEQCDPNAPGWSTETCSNTCEIIETPPEPYCGDGNLDAGEQCEKVNGVFLPGCENCLLKKPTCSVSVNPDHGNVPQQVEVTSNMPSWATVVYLNMGGGSSNINNPTFPYQYTYYNAGSYQIKLKVRNNYDQYGVPYNGNLESEDFVARCYAYFTGTTPPPEPECGDGNLDEGEQCDPGSNNFGNGCNEYCQLMVPSCTLTVSPSSGPVPLDTIISATKPSWATFTSLLFGDGTPLVSGPVFPLPHTYNTAGMFNLVLGVKNNYAGPIAAGVTKPTANCTAVVSAINPGDPVPYLLKQQKTGGMANFTSNQINVQIGDIITYKVNFGNSGTVAATGEVWDILPPCTNYLTSSIHLPNGVTYNGPITTPYLDQTMVKYKDFRLQPGKGGYMLVDVQIRGTGMHGTTSCQNITSYLNTGYFKFVGYDKLESAVVAVRPTGPAPQPYLSIVKEQLTTGNLPAGSIVTYKITVTNTGSAAATGVSIYDELPRELTYISSNITIVPYSTYSFQTGTIGVGINQRTYVRYYNITLGANGTATIYLTGKVKNGYTFDTLTNCASVSGSNIPQQNSCTTWTPPTPPTPPTTGYSIKKELLTTGNIVPGSTVSYKVTLTNTGDQTYYNMYIDDTWPNALEYLTSSIVGVPNNGYLFSTWTDVHGLFHIKYYNFVLNPHSTVIVYLTGVLREGYNFDETTNCALTTGNLVDCALLSLKPQPYVKKWQRLSDSDPFVDTQLTVNAGQTIYYKVDFGNVGGKGATGEVRDILPNCVQYQDAWLEGVNGDGPSFPSQNIVLFTNIYLEPLQTGSLMVIGKIRNDGDCQGVYEYLNTGEFHFLGEKWLKSTVLAVRPETPTTKVSITKDVDVEYVNPEDYVTYTIRYTNEGPDTLVDYTIVDYWPGDKLEFVSSDPQADYHEGNILKWYFNGPANALPPTESRTIILTGRVLP